MKLAGDLAEFSLPDLLQVKSAARQTAGLRILGPDGNGLIALRDGEVVHAQYEELVGEAAFHALMGVKAGYFEAAKLEEPVFRNVDRPMRALLLEAFRLAESGRLPRPAARVAPTFQPEGPRNVVETSTPRQRGKWLPLALALLSGLLILGAAAALLLPRRGTAVTRAPAAPTSERVFEAGDLHGAGDRPPELVAGAPPVAPRDGVAVLPTVVCRLRIDSRGAVAEVKIYRSRLEFAEFEELAIRAAQSYRFRPAMHAGREVASWINLPVEFR